MHANIGHPRPSIRQEYDSRFRELGIDCFTLYTEDLWQPEMMIPHEVDTRLYYPEPMFGGPLKGFGDLHHEALLESTPINGLQYKFYYDAKKAPGDRLNTDMLDIGSEPYHALFGSFAEREEIKSMIVFRPVVAALSSIQPNAQRELLFLNFRSVQKLELQEEKLRNLSELARDIFARLASDVETRRDFSWSKSMLMTLRCQSRCSRWVREELLPRVGPELDENGSPVQSLKSFDRLAEIIREELKRPNERLHVSIYMRTVSPAWESNSANDTQRLPRSLLVCRGSAGRTRFHQEEQDLVTSVPTITSCTTLTGRSHLLQYIEDDSLHKNNKVPNRRTALDLMPHESALVSVSDLNERFGTKQQVFSLCTVSKKKNTNRLIFEGEWSVENNPSLKNLEAYWTNLGLDKALLDKLKKRINCKYARIFGYMDTGWEHPCSEVCIPIIIGNRCVGCVNIESDRPDRFNPAIINALLAVASTVGEASTIERREILLDCVVDVSKALHNPSRPGTTQDNGARTAVRLDTMAKKAADALGCTKLDIFGTTSPLSHDLQHLVDRKSVV